MGLRFTSIAISGWLLFWATAPSIAAEERNATVEFIRDVQPILASHCLKCHGADESEAGLRFTDRTSATKELDSGLRAVAPGNIDESELLRRVHPTADERMPPEGPPLTDKQIALLKQWIAEGANWPTHWALAPLKKPPVPVVREEHRSWVRTPIDAFIVDALLQKNLRPAPAADKRTLLRRVYFDLIGLPPTPAEIQAFLSDTSPTAYEKVVDRLLASERYGERWARHWLDVVHYADTHGHDEDAVRENAWPYRDYLINSLNEDKPYTRFVQEQIAGDVLFPHEAGAVAATGMLAAGPWDESSQMGIQDGTTDKEIARYLDRDDMIATVMNTFVSMTVHCARCHDHKFDPISTADYYSLQAVFAGVDRVDRPFDRSPDIAKRRRELQREKAELAAGTVSVERLRSPAVKRRVVEWEDAFAESGGVWQVCEADSFHSDGGATVAKQADGSILFSGARPETDVYTISTKVTMPRITAVRLEVLTDTSLFQQGPGRQDNGNLHLSEFRLLIGNSDQVKPVALHKPVADFDQQGWTIAHALDGNPKTAWGIFPQVGQSHEAIFELQEPIAAADGVKLTFVLEQLHGGVHLIGRPRLSATSAAAPQIGDSLPPDMGELLAIDADKRTAEQQTQLALHVLKMENEAALAALPEQAKVYAVASDFPRNGNFVPAKSPRPVHVLRRGDVLSPIRPAEAGSLSCIPELDSRFTLQDKNDEGQRRAALAKWISADENVLLWRSIVNRVWHYHFGRGIVATCSDFGRNGSPPSHPELLDWLAAWFRDSTGGGGSLKRLHKLLVTSSVYRQSSQHNAKFAAVDQDNRYLWRMNRQRLDAESVRDAIAQMSGRIDFKMGGPPVRQFKSGKGVHVTPTIDYESFDVDSDDARRRSIYRFIFRTVPDPLMEALDCPDASQFTPQRTASITAVQALAMLNNRFVVRYCEHLAVSIKNEHAEPKAQIERLFELAYGRPPSENEANAVAKYAREHGLANACRVIINSNEFMFID